MKGCSGCFILIGGLVLMGVISSITSSDYERLGKWLIFISIVLLIFFTILAVFGIKDYKKRTQTIDDACELLRKMNQEVTGWTDSAWEAVNESKSQRATILQLSQENRQFAILRYDIDKKRAYYSVFNYEDLEEWHPVKEKETGTSSYIKIAIIFSVNIKGQTFKYEICLHDSYAINESSGAEHFAKLTKLQLLLNSIKPK